LKDAAMDQSSLPLGTLGALLFTLMGPIAAIPLFAKATAGADRALQRQIGLRACLVALAALAIAVFIGAGVLSGWGVSPASLIVAAGIILLMTALRNVLGAGGVAAPEGDRPPPGLATAMSPIAIPGLVTPTGVAVLVIFVSYFPGLPDKLAVMGVAAGLMALNFLAMLAANWVLRVVGASPLLVLGAVFGVLQAAMGVEMVLSGVRRSGLFG
jgi:multiple antibiotic resistance protein